MGGRFEFNVRSFLHGDDLTFLGRLMKIGTDPS